MTNDKKELKREDQIEFAIIAVKDAAMLYERFMNQGDNAATAKALKKLHEAQNDLYDAIGGMDEYKFDLED